MNSKKFSKNSKLVTPQFCSCLFFVLLLLGLPVGCSKTGAGKNGTDEELLNGGVSDQDLALEDEQSRFGSGNVPQAKEGTVFEDVHFEFQSSVVRQEDYEIIRKNAAMIAGDPTLHAEIEGHCDKRGTAEYNMALGEERAKAVAAVMSSYGVKPEQLSTISYGEEIPLDPRDSEGAFAKNRRAHFAVYRKNTGAASQGGAGQSAKNGYSRGRERY